MEGELTMSRKERDRLKAIEAVLEKRLKQGEAAKQLGLSVRQVKRLVRAHREEGAAGLISTRRGQASNRRIEDRERDEVMACVRSRYADFARNGRLRPAFFWRSWPDCSMPLGPCDNSRFKMPQSAHDFFESATASSR